MISGNLLIPTAAEYHDKRNRRRDSLNRDTRIAPGWTDQQPQVLSWQLRPPLEQLMERPERRLAAIPDHPLISKLSPNQWCIGP